MGWSAGSFSRTNGVNTGVAVWADDRDEPVKILAGRHDTHDQDLSDGIDACLTKDGANEGTTQSPGDDSTKVATTAYADTAVANAASDYEPSDGNLTKDNVTETLTAVWALGAPTATTQSAGNNTTKVATTAFVNTEITNDALLQGRDSFYVGVENMLGYTSSGDPSDLKMKHASSPYTGMKLKEFDPDAIEIAQFRCVMPKKWNEGTITFKAYHYTQDGGSSTDNVVWGMACAAASNAESINPATGTYVDVTDDATSGVSITSESGAITVGGSPVAGDTLAFRVRRNATSGSDEWTADAGLLGVMIFYTTNAGDDT